MADSVLTDQRIVKHPSDAQTYAVDFTLPLNGRTIASVDSIAADSGLTVSNEAIVTSSYTDDSTGETVAANKAVQFLAQSGTAGSDYKVTIVCTLSDGNTLTGVTIFEVRDGSESE